LNNNIDHEEIPDLERELLSREDEAIQEPIKKPIISMIWTVLFILVLSIISVGCYEPLKNYVISEEKTAKDYFESDDFLYTLIGFTNYLEQSMINENASYYSHYQDNTSLKFYVINKDTKKVTSNIDNVSANNLDTLIEDSQFYLKINFNEKDDISVQEVSDKTFNKEAFVSSLKANENAITSSEILYIIPKTLSPSNDFIINNITSYSLSSYIILILIIGGVSILILCIIAFSIPYSYQKRVSLCYFYNKMFLEFKVLVGFAFLGACVLLITLITEYYNSQALIDMIFYATAYFYAIGITITFIIYQLIYLNIVYIKFIYYSGFQAGFIQNSLIGKMTSHVIMHTKNLILSLLRIDFKKDYYRKLLLLLGINLFALMIIGISWPFGFVLAIAYSILLFNFLLKILNKIKMLTDSTSTLAAGAFDGVLDEDMGLLKPLAENLNHIKDGFRAAVDKEIKSQNMKTELISSVSHDLKTPLTSIITYIDLLKDETLNTEKQKEYINVLDKKSKRLKVLIEDLFEVSKATSGNIELRLETIDVVSLLKQTLGELQEKISASGLHIKTSFPDHKITCHLDGQRSYRIFENLISNISKYSLPHSRVYISIEEDARTVRITFKNISAYEMNFDVCEITERFTRGDKARHTDGSGLGLAIAKGLTELQDGTLDVYVDGDLFKVILAFHKISV
jgi:signal transduction histidine kinase